MPPPLEKYRVYCYYADSGDTQPSPIHKLFTDAGIDVHVLTGNGTTTPAVDTRISRCGKRTCTTCSSNTFIPPATSDYEIFRQVVQAETAASSPMNSDGGVIIIKSTTVTSSTTIDDLESALINAKSVSTNFDIFYFARWLDRPELYEVQRSLDGGGKLIRTWSPHGLQAVAITKVGYDALVAKFPPDHNPVVCRPFAQVINQLIQRGELTAMSTTPPLLSFDATLVSLQGVSGNLHEPFSYLKTCEARAETHPERPLHRRISTDLTAFWIVVIIITVSVAIWVLVSLGAVVVV